MQEYLNAILQPSPHLTEDGVFGPKTKAAVIAFQQQFGLNPDGITGPLTWAEIMRQAAYSPVPAGTKTVVIDPGHGGTDWGAVHYYRKEKDDNLRLAQAVHDVLEAHGQNLQIIMTRYDDVFLTLAERSALSNQNNADLFVSIHRNSSENRSANGVENFVFTAAPTPDVVYAYNVLDGVVDAGVQSNRGVKRGNFAVLRNTRAPSMLLEVGFISNEIDNQLFDQNFDAYATAIAYGILESLAGTGELPPPFFFYTVVSGDSMQSIAQHYNTTEADIMALNKLTQNTVVVGQVLKIPVV